MIVWATIVVEQLHGHWSAWFKNEPEIGFGGEWPSQAIERLLDARDRELYNTNEVYTIEDQARDGHLEFRIRVVGGDDEFPRPSMN
ncbi:MAG: hypothetical protein JWP89_2692 [Schlesneria sp.]|nr:hypothetical protein [Schlesneria sp.]